MGAGLTAILDASVRVLDADAELMLRFQAGEASCFDELVGRYRKPLLGFVYRMVGDRDASEEILQEVFLRVYLHRARYQPTARFSTWVYRIASHLALNHRRDHRREERMERLDEAVRRGRVREAVTGLPGRQRVAVILHKYQGLDYEEIAGALELSASATKSLLFRAYERLRRELKDLL